MTCNSDEPLWAEIAAGMITPAHIAPGKAKPTPDAVEQIAHRTCSTYTHGERPTYAFERHTLQDFAYRLSGLMDAQAEVLESEKAQLRAEIERLQSNLSASAQAFVQLEAVAAEARRNDAIAMSWISKAKRAIGYEGDMPGFIGALRELNDARRRVPAKITVSQAPHSQYAKGWNNCVDSFATPPASNSST